jgi:hypothetical protein
MSGSASSFSNGGVFAGVLVRWCSAIKTRTFRGVKKRETYLVRSVDVQLFAHRWLSAATCDTSSRRRMKSTFAASFVPPTSTRLRYSEMSSRAPLSRRPRGAGVYFPTPGISRAKADDAAAVMGLIGVACECVGCEWPARPEEEEEEDARKNGSKCSLSRSNSSDSGAESSNFCNCAATETG